MNKLKIKNHPIDATLKNTQEYIDFINELDEINNFNLKISNQVIEFKNSVYPMRNIASTKVIDKILIENIFVGKKAMLVSFGLFLTIFFTTTFTTVLAIIGVFGMIVASKMFKPIEHKYYGLALVTNAGTNDLLYSEDKEFILKISEIITKAMIENKNIKYSIHIGDKNFINNSNVEINSNIDLNIEHHQGISKDDMEFLIGEFKNSLEKIYTEINSIKEFQAAKEELDNIVKEINSKQPNASKIKKSWDIIKKTCEGYDTINTLAEFGSMIGRATMIFV